MQSNLAEVVAHCDGLPNQRDLVAANFQIVANFPNCMGEISGKG